MRKQRLMGITFIVIAWLVLLLTYGGENPEDSDATAVLIVAPLGLYMLCSDTYLLYDGDTVEEGEDNHQTARKELQHGKKASYRGTEPQILGGRE